MMKNHVYSIRNNIACMDFLCIKNIVFEPSEKYLTNILSSGYNSMNMPK